MLLTKCFCYTNIKINYSVNGQLITYLINLHAHRNNLEKFIFYYIKWECIVFIFQYLNVFGIVTGQLKNTISSIVKYCGILCSEHLIISIKTRV